MPTATSSLTATLNRTSELVRQIEQFRRGCVAASEAHKWVDYERELAAHQGACYALKDIADKLAQELAWQNHQKDLTSKWLNHQKDEVR